MASLTLLSLILGIAAWVLPCFAFKQYRKGNYKNGTLLCIASICSCTMSILLEIFYTNHLVNIGDFISLMDTYSTLTFVCTVLVAVTIPLNIVTVIAFYGKDSKIQ